MIIIIIQIGFKQDNLITLLLIQAFMFSIPGTVFGITLGYLLNTIFCFFIFSYAKENSTYNLHYSALVLGISIGIIMPIISNIVPIMRALAKTLRESLNILQRAESLINIQIMKLDNLGLSPVFIFKIVFIKILNKGLINYVFDAHLRGTGYLLFCAAFIFIHEYKLVFGPFKFDLDSLYNGHYYASELVLTLARKKGSQSYCFIYKSLCYRFE